ALSQQGLPRLPSLGSPGDRGEGREGRRGGDAVAAAFRSGGHVGAARRRSGVLKNAQPLRAAPFTASIPPSTAYDDPVTNDERGPARKAMTSATSSRWPTRSI